MAHQQRNRPRRRSDPVRVCFFIDELSRAGTETQLVALIRQVDRRRVLPHLCLLRGERNTSRALEPSCCPVLRLGVGSLATPATLGKAAMLAGFLHKHQIDVLQVFFRDSTYLGVPVGRLAGVPVIIRTRNNLGYALSRLDRRLGRLCNRLVDYTIANCSACRDAALTAEGPPRKGVVVLENGVDLARFARVSTIRAFRAPVQVGVLANLRPIKDLETFILAAREVIRTHPDITFTIGGEGPMRCRLEQLARDLGMEEKLRLPGVVKDVAAFLAALDICVLGSRSEGLSNAVLEYMACGRPIVATRVGGTPELIEDGLHGLLVPPGDSAVLAQALRYLLDHRDRAATLAAAARQRAQVRFSREKMILRFEAFYEECLDQITDSRAPLAA
jgi:glycosyltransferase involved in cell wall biosynthesis